jgi:hypothetical protein
MIEQVVRRVTRAKESGIMVVYCPHYKGEVVVVVLVKGKNTRYTVQCPSN